jgi:RNA polymerase sigma-70 factor (ECF subfamily)
VKGEVSGMEHGIDSYQRFLDGDESALEAIIASYKDGLILFLNGFVGDLVTAEELTEEVFVKLVLKRPFFYRTATFKTWLYTIARNTAIDHLRRNKRTQIPLEDCPHLADEEELERSYIRRDDKLLLHACMKKLKPEYRQVLWLFYFEGFSCQQIGRIMKKTTHGVETLAYRARLALKNILIKEGFDYEGL